MEDILQTLLIDPERYHVISAVGAGGKTTLLYALAEAFFDLGKRVIVTTTTHMAIPNRYAVLTEDAALREMFIKSAVREQVVTVGIPDETEDGAHKMHGLPKEELEALRKYCDVLLVEADGSRRLPVKAPEHFEPVIPDMTQLVLGVQGAAAVDRRIADVSCRTDKVCEILAKKPEDLVSVDDLVTLLLHDRGQKKGVFCDYRAVINQSEVLSDEQKNYVSRLGILHTSFPVLKRA